MENNKSTKKNCSTFENIFIYLVCTHNMYITCVLVKLKIKIGTRIRLDYFYPHVRI